MALSNEQYNALASELDDVKQQVQAQLGEADARYIRRVLLVQRISAAYAQGESSAAAVAIG